MQHILSVFVSEIKRNLGYCVYILVSKYSDPMGLFRLQKVHSHIQERVSSDSITAAVKLSNIQNASLSLNYYKEKNKRSLIYGDVNNKMPVIKLCFLPRCILLSSPPTVFHILAHSVPLPIKNNHCLQQAEAFFLSIHLLRIDKILLRYVAGRGAYLKLQDTSVLS